MPVSGFVSSLATKAHSAINANLPGHGRPASPDSAAQPSANQAASQGGLKGHALDSIQHHLRAFGQQYTTTTPVQKIITAEKGVSIALDSVSRGAKSQSKELYMWGHSEAEDIRDVTDRLAYLNFVQGSLSSTLATKLNAARAPFKSLRDVEAALTPRRNIRAGYQLQISRIENDQQKGSEARIRELKDQLRKAEQEDEPQEKQVALLKRKAVRDSEQLKWDAIREYAEKLLLLSKAATPIINALPTFPPTEEQPYTGAQTTAAVRGSLHHTLDNYKPGDIELPLSTGPADLNRADTRSFGESHASELSSITSDHSPRHSQTELPASPPMGTVALHDEHPASSGTSPIDPGALNQSPAQIPNVPSATVSSSPTSGSAPAINPTVAETGVPITGSAGPASGSLHDLRSTPQGNKPSTPGSAQPAEAVSSVASAQPSHETAEEEKRRLQREERERILSGGGQSSTADPTASGHETAEEEKRRIERENRERILRQEDDGEDGARAEEDLPPYQEQ